MCLLVLLLSTNHDNRAGTTNGNGLCQLGSPIFLRSPTCD